MKIDDSQILLLLNNLEKNSEGWTSKRKLVSEIQKEFLCSLPTAYAIIHRSSIFETRHGKIRTLQTYKPIKLDVSYYQEWSKERNIFLDKVVGFLVGKQNIEDLLVYIGGVRDQLADGVESELENLFCKLNQKFGSEIIDSEIEKGMLLRLPPKEGTEIARQISAEAGGEEEPKISILDLEQEEEEAEEEESEVEEVLPSGGEEL